jgi:hypothetical protein
MYWANFLHIYQPPTQKPYWIERVTKESYRKIIKELKQAPKAKVTFNINACLTEMLVKHGFSDVIKDLKKLAQKGQVELIESAKFHPFFPILPETEIIRQIKLNNQTNKKFFGKVYQPKGFFSPEMAYNKKVAEIVAKLGYKWIILDEPAFSREFGRLDHETIYKIKNLPCLDKAASIDRSGRTRVAARIDAERKCRKLELDVYFREREMSFKILSAQLGTGKILLKYLGNRLKKNEYLLTAMDGETFGHHRLGLEKLLFDLYQAKELKTVSISELPKYFRKTREVEPLSSTWALMEKDLEKNAPFSRWFDPSNEIHQMQWKLTNLAIQAVENSNPKLKGYRKARLLLDKSLHSDQYWWASARPWWSLENIEAGAKELKDVVLAVPDASSQMKEEAEELYKNILYTGFEWQRKGIVEELARQEDEEIRQRMDVEVPYIPRQEFVKMIKTLETQMLEAAKNLEYERAAQFRERIRELKEQKLEITKKKFISRRFEKEPWGM